MESALALWNRRKNEPWIAGVNPTDFCERVSRRQAMLQAGSRVLNLEPAPVDFIAGVFATATYCDPVELFLGSERWSDRERTTAVAFAHPDIVWGGTNVARDPSADRAKSPLRRLIMIPSGGTTGGLRFAVHTWDSLGVAAAGLQQWLGGGPINSVCLLPLHHVSGLMQVVRSFVSDGRLWLGDWSEIERGNFPGIEDFSAVTSLVPTQLERLRHVRGASAWLQRFRCVFLGGARAGTGLLRWAREERIRLAPGYGMTETAAQVATMRPERFLAGEEIAAEALPHAAIRIVDETDRTPVAAGVTGRIEIETAALFRGYYPDCAEPRRIFLTGDRGVLEGNGGLRLHGRIDAIINTGGEKVDPAEVEHAILETGLAQIAVVFGAPDETWGEVVVAAVVRGTTSIEERELQRRLRDALAAHKLPKRWLWLDALPQNAAGKVDLPALRLLASRTD